jgi:hypothetical protein
MPRFAFITEKVVTVKASALTIVAPHIAVVDASELLAGSVLWPHTVVVINGTKRAELTRAETQRDSEDDIVAVVYRAPKLQLTVYND